MKMRTKLIKKLALKADPVYRDSDTDYRLTVPIGHRACKSMQTQLDAQGLDYSLHDGFIQVYVTADDLAKSDVTDDDMLLDDMREQHARHEQLMREQEQKQREKEARLLGQYEAMLAVHIEDPRQRVVLGLRLVEAAKEVL
jgi:hypothetical protein